MNKLVISLIVFSLLIGGCQGMNSEDGLLTAEETKRLAKEYVLSLDENTPEYQFYKSTEESETKWVFKSVLEAYEYERVDGEWEEKKVEYDEAQHKRWIITVLNNALRYELISDTAPYMEEWQKYDVVIRGPKILTPSSGMTLLIDRETGEVVLSYVQK